MKSVVSYLFFPLWVCMYMTATMGFGLHFCDVEGSSKLLLMAGESPCHHNQHENEEEERHDDRCCHTLVYVLDEAQNCSDYVKLDAPEVVDIAPLRSFMTIPVLSALSLCAFYVADIVYGPGGGLALVAPLRL